MVIHLTASRSNVKKDFETLKKIVGVIHKAGAVLARDWIEPQYHIEVTKKVKELNPRDIFKFNIESIDRADIVIVEASERSFGNGFQVAAALSKKKPTLILVRKDCEEIESSMSKGLEDALLRRIVYGSFEKLEKEILKFIEENTITNKDLRFNFVIDRQIYNHIRQKSYKTNKTKAEVVRELLNRDIEAGEI